MKKIALKFCGGCDPAYDRIEYWKRIEAAACGRIEWTRVSEPGFDALLLINGCRRACPEKDIDEKRAKLLSVKDEGLEPEDLIEILLQG